MFTTAIHRIEADFGKNRLLQWLLVGYVLLWIVLAIAPLDRRDWFLENLLVFLTTALLIGTYRIFPLSDLSYALITLFMTLHAIGAHYTYSLVPVGFWMQEAFHFSRNPFDRIVHFSFGLLMAYPVREVFLRVANARGFWAYYLPLDVTLAFSGMFEILESWIAQAVSPQLGDAYLGTQGDIWDAQKDMTLALLGAILCMILTATVRKRLRMGPAVPAVEQGGVNRG